MPTYRARKPRLPRSFATRNQLGLPTGPSLSSPTISSGSPSAFYRGTTTPAPTPPIPILAGLAGGAAGGAGAAPGRKPAGTFPSARPPASVDPYAPQTPEQISAQVAAAVKAQTDPVLKQIADQIAARTTAAQQAIIGYTNAFGPALQQLAGIGPAGYQTGIQSQAAIDSALQQSLTGGGTAAASELGAKLAQINAPQADQQVAAQAAIGAGAGNAALATGSASLSALVAQLAGAQNAAAKQPGIAALYGGQATRDLQAQASRDLVDQQGQVTSQIPGLISTLTTDAQNRRDTQASTARATATSAYNSGLISQRQLGQALGLPGWQKLPNTVKSAATMAGKPIGNSQSGYWQQNPRTGQWQQVIPSVTKTGAAARPFTIRPGDTVEIPDGKGGYKAYSAPAAPKDPKSPKTISTPTGTMQWDPRSGAWSTIPGTEPSAGPTKTTLDSLKVAAGGGWNPQTGALTPDFRAQLKAFAGVDPGPTLTRQQMTAMGIQPKPAAPKAPRAPKITGTSSTSKYVITYNPDGTVKSRQPNPNYVPPKERAGATVKPKVIVSSATSKYIVTMHEDGSITKVANPNYKKTSASVKQLSPADVADSARDAFNGIPDNIVKVVDPATGKVVAKNEPIPQQSYDDAFRDLVLHGADPDMAKKALNRYYKPGQRGRPATTTDYLRDSAIFWQRDNKGNIVAYRRYRNKQTGQERRQAIGIVSPQDPNYKQARAKANAMATS